MDTETPERTENAQDDYINHGRFSVFQDRDCNLLSQTISADDLAEKARNPRIGAKETAPVITPHNASGKRKDAAQSAEFCAVVVDHDDGETSRADIECNYKDTAYIAFTTSSHMQDGKGERWKVVLPLAEPLEADNWAMLAEGAAHQMGGDRAQARVQQVFYAPNKLSTNAPYEHIVSLDADYLSPNDALGEQFMGSGREIRAEQRESARSASVKGGGGSNPAFQRINAQIDIADVLGRSGYRKMGSRWMSPKSQSGTPGVVILDDDDKPRLYSHHGADDRLSSENHNGHALDALDVVAILDYGGDRQAAIKDYAPSRQSLEDRARQFTQDQDSGDIEDLLIDALALPKFDQKRVFHAIKKATGANIGDLKEQSRILAQGDRESIGDLDDRAIANRVIDEIGRPDMLSDDGGLWRYRDGVWRLKTEQATESAVQTHMSTMAGDLNSGRVVAVSQVMRRAVYRHDHEWNVGADDAVNVENGLLVMQRGAWRLREHKREDYRQTKLPVSYDPAAEAPRFDRFLDEIFEGDADAAEKRAAVLEMIGYSLMSHARYEKYMVLCGKPGTGKSKLLKVVEDLCGAEHTAAVRPAQMDNDYHRANLRGKLVNVVSELPEGGSLPDDQIKSIVSGESSTARSPYGSPFEFAPYSTIWIATNHMPSCRDHSGAVQARTMIVGCNREFRGTEQADPKLSDTLALELPGILNMALAAYAGVVERGYFTEPQSSAQAKVEWQFETDQIAQFLDECCKSGPGSTPTREVYSAYQRWADQNGIQRRYASNKFSNRVSGHGFRKDRQRQVWHFFGLILNAEGQQNAHLQDHDASGAGRHPWQR